MRKQREKKNEIKMRRDERREKKRRKEMVEN